MAERCRIVCALAVLVAALSGAAAARVQTYQIMRLLSYKTDCQLAHLDEKPAPSPGSMAFFAACDNVTFYPHGIDILCSDREDERSCRILTDAARFDQLHLMQK